MNDDFGVRVGIKAVTAALEFLAKFREVVDFSVEDDPQTFVFVMDRLPSAGKVDDAQAPHTQSRWATGVNTLIVRTSVNDGLAHPPNVSGIDNVSGVADHASYSAHGFTSKPARAEESSISGRLIGAALN
jgi:hypothetical protein